LEPYLQSKYKKERRKHLESQLTQKLVQKIIRELEGAGRNQSLVRSRLRWLLFNLEMSCAPAGEWSEEYRTWLLGCFDQALVLAGEEAVRREEYEWAAELRVLHLDMLVVEEV